LSFTLLHENFCNGGVCDGKVRIELDDPLFLHPSDHPGQALVDIFNGEDYEN